MATQTSASNLNRIQEMFVLMQSPMTLLADRWDEESKFEDIKTYQAVIEKSLPKGFTITKMTKKPFGFHFSIGTDAIYSLAVQKAKYVWKRIL